MSVYNSAVRKLYLPYGMHKSSGGSRLLSDVTYHWFCVGRETPLAPYASLILNYGRLAAPERLRAEQMTDELLSEEEYHQLRDYLLKSCRVSVQTAVLTAPLNSNASHTITKAEGLRPFLNSLSLPVEEPAHLASCKLDEEEGYSLPFRIWGLAVLGPRRIVPRPQQGVVLASPQPQPVQLQGQP